MNKVFFLSFIFILFICNFSISQEIRGVKGYETKPYIFNMKDLPSFGELYMGKVPKKNFNNVKPPYKPDVPIPNIEEIPNFTLDKNANMSPSFAPGLGVGFEGIAQSGSIPSVMNCILI